MNQPDRETARISRREVIRRGDPPSALRDIDIESCGKSRIPLDGLVSKLHLDNLVTLYKQLAA